MNYSSTAKIRQLSMLNLVLGNVDRETTISEYWGYLCLSAEVGGERGDLGKYGGGAGRCLPELSADTHSSWF